MVCKAAHMECRMSVRQASTVGEVCSRLRAHLRRCSLTPSQSCPIARAGSGVKYVS